MLNSNKRIGLVIFILLLTLTLAACGGSGQGASTSSANSSGNNSTSSSSNSSGSSQAANSNQSASNQSASSQSSQNQKPQPGGTLKVAYAADAVQLDPAKQDAASSAYVLEQIYESLTRIDKTGSVQPSLAKSWDISDDHLTYTFHLRDAKFSDGTPMTATDVKYTFQRILDKSTNSPARPYFTDVTSIDVKDPHTVVFHLKKPFAPFLVKLAGTNASIVSKKFVEAHNGKIKNVALGTGPFSLVKWDRKTEIDLKKNQYYWDKPKPYVNKLVIKPISDDTTRTTAVKTGDVQFADQLPSKDVASLKKYPGLKVVGGPTTAFTGIQLNNKTKPFNNVKVRQAVAYAINRKQIVDQAIFGLGSPIYCGPIPKGDWAHCDTKVYQQNVAKAKQLLKDAGYSNGLTVTLKVGSNYKSLVNMAQVVQQELKPVGINVKIKQMEWGLWLSDVVNKRNYQMSIVGWTGSVDPDDFLYLLFHSGARLNFTQYSNPKVDQLLEQGRSTLDQNKRKQIYVKAQQLIAKDAPWVFIDNGDNFQAISNKLHGYTYLPDGSKTHLKDAWLGSGQ